MSQYVKVVGLVWLLVLRLAWGMRSTPHSRQSLESIKSVPQNVQCPSLCRSQFESQGFQRIIEFHDASGYVTMACLTLLLQTRSADKVSSGDAVQVGQELSEETAGIRMKTLPRN